MRNFKEFQTRFTKFVFFSFHVRLPCSEESSQPEFDNNGVKTFKLRWELIEESLLTNILTSRDLEKAIKSYNLRYAEIWNFAGLHSLFNDHYSDDQRTEFFNDTLPKIIEVALQLPQLIKRRIPLLKQGSKHSISMTQQVNIDFTSLEM